MLGALAHAEFDTAAAHQIERCDPLGDARGVHRGQLHDAWARRIWRVRWLAAARNTSGAGECEYSSRKWCSTSQAKS